ncbi:hypothetical protein [Rhizomicrobium electricum]|uniref:Uncharacterized protein n=1 Tax=Rhizomicrobium electricum TaxID=480070 RepID=A0ABN1E1E3_9PROT|nr:hypothetical protein [Rhizomicrobium electricum]NIJ47411.1 putative membrane protein [Rhizomicrobium electricum]
MEVVTSFPTYFVGFLHTLCVMPTLVYVVVVALFFGLITNKFAGVIFIPVLAAAVFIAAQVIGPVVINNAALTMPEFNLAFAKMAVACYAVFLVLDTVVFAIKKLVGAIIDR